MGKKSSSLRTEFSRKDRRTFCGFVYESSNEKKFSVELLVDGEPVSVTLSDEPVAGLVEAGVGDGCFGFTFTIPEEVVSNATIVETRLANLGVPVGKPIECAELSDEDVASEIGGLRWVGGLRFEGWLEGQESGPIEVIVAGQPVMSVSPNGWTHVQRGDAYGSARRIDFHLPRHFADGRVRRVSARTDKGRVLGTVAVPFVAFEDGLEQTLARLGRWDSERLRGRLFDRLLPASVPLHEYAEWKTSFAAETMTHVPLEAAVLLIGDRRLAESIDSLEADHRIAWTASSLPTGEAFSRFDRKAALEFLQREATSSSFVVFCPSGTIFTSDALIRLAEVFQTYPDCRSVYADIEVQGKSGAVLPVTFPAFDVERTLEQGYGALFFALRYDVALDLLRSRDSLYRLFIGQLTEQNRSGIYHLPGALAAVPPIDIATAADELADAVRDHFEAAQVPVHVEVRSNVAFAAVRVGRKIPAAQRTTVIIPTRNRAPLLKRCIESIRPAIEREGATILVIDNDSTDDETIAFLDQARSENVDVLEVRGPFNFARLNNVAVRYCETENICLLNNDVEAMDDAWLGEMLSRLSDPGVGAVGAKLIWPSGVVQHGGVVLGVNFGAGHAFNDRMDGDPGYGGLLEVAHECSAVTAACLLMRKSDYLAYGEMDEIHFPVNFNDVDLCLKLRQAGKRIVLSPDAKLLHLESASRGRDLARDRKARFERELLSLRAKWGETLMADPYYSPLLGLDSTPFSSLAWPPRSWNARKNETPQPNVMPPGFCVD